MNILKKPSMAMVGAVFFTLGVGGIAQAFSFSEVEPNDTFDTAQLLDTQDKTITVTGSRLGDNSADFFRFSVTAGDSINLDVKAPDGPEYEDDPVLGLYDSTGDMINVDDDGGDGYNSRIRNVSINSSGFYTAAVSGYPDFDFDGKGDYEQLFNDGFSLPGTDFTYELQVESVPEPLTIVGSAIALGFGVLMKRQYSRKYKKI